MYMYYMQYAACLGFKYVAKLGILHKPHKVPCQAQAAVEGGRGRTPHSPLIEGTRILGCHTPLSLDLRLHPAADQWWLELDLT